MFLPLLAFVTEDIFRSVETEATKWLPSSLRKLLYGYVM